MSGTSTQSLSGAIQDFKSKFAAFKKNYNDYALIVDQLMVQNQIKSDTYVVKNYTTYPVGGYRHLIGSVTEVSDPSGCQKECTKLYNCTGAVYDTLYHKCALYSGDNNIKTAENKNKKVNGRYLALKNQRIYQINDAWKKLLNSKKDLVNSMSTMNQAFLKESSKNTTLDSSFKQMIASYTNGKGDDMIEQVNNIEKSMATTSAKKDGSFQLYNKNISLYIPLTLFAGALAFGIYSFSSTPSVSVAVQPTMIYR